MIQELIRCRPDQKYELDQFRVWLNREFPKLNTVVVDVEGTSTTTPGYALVAHGKLGQKRAFAARVLCKFVQDILDEKFPERPQEPGARSPENHGQNDEQNAVTGSTDS